MIIISKILRTVLFQKRVNDKDVAKHHIITHDLFLITNSFCNFLTHCQEGLRCGFRMSRKNKGV